MRSMVESCSVGAGLRQRGGHYGVSRAMVDCINVIIGSVAR